MATETSNWIDNEFRDLLSVRADAELVRQIQGTARDSVVYEEMTPQCDSHVLPSAPSRERGVYGLNNKVLRLLSYLLMLYVGMQIFFR